MGPIWISSPYRHLLRPLDSAPAAAPSLPRHPGDIAAPPRAETNTAISSEIAVPAASGRHRYGRDGRTADGSRPARLRAAAVAPGPQPVAPARPSLHPEVRTRRTVVGKTSSHGGGSLPSYRAVTRPTPARPCGRLAPRVGMASRLAPRVGHTAACTLRRRSIMRRTIIAAGSAAVAALAALVLWWASPTTAQDPARRAARPGQQR